MKEAYAKCIPHHEKVRVILDLQIQFLQKALCFLPTQYLAC